MITDGQLTRKAQSEHTVPSEHGHICLPLILRGQQYRKYSSKDKVGKVRYGNKYYLCRKDFDIIIIFV